MSIRLVFFGTSAFGIPALNVIANSKEVTLVGVVTQPAREIGRQKTITETAVAQWAQQYNIPVLTPTSLRDDQVQADIAALQADVFLVAAYGLLLPQEILDLPGRGSINIHASLLPRYRGASPIAAAIVNGDQVTGTTFMLMDAGCDTGPVLAQYPLPIEPTETRPQLEQRLAELSATHLEEVVLGWLNDQVEPKIQPVEGAVLCQKLQRADGRATWKSALQLERNVRAYTPWPGVWTSWNGKEIKILEAHALPQRVIAQPGTVVRHERSWAIVCTSGLFIPTVIQFSGRQPQDARTVPGSYPNFIGALLG